MGWVGNLWGRMTEGAARIVESKRMSDAERQEWTAAVYMVRAAWDYQARQTSTAPDESGGVARFGSKISAPRAAPRWVRDTWGTSSGPVYLAWEAHQLGLISQRQLDRDTYDTVYWVTGVTAGAAPKLRRIARDFSTWKKSVAEELERFGLTDPRDDNRLRGWALGLLIAGAATAALVVVVASGGLAAPGVAAAVAALGGAGSVVGGVTAGTAAIGTVMYATADASERTYNDEAARIAGLEVSMEGSAVGTALAGGLGAAGASYASGQQKASDVASAFARGYADTAAAYGAPPAPVAPPTPPESELVTWAKSTGGMITIGALAVLLVALAVRK